MNVVDSLLKLIVSQNADALVIAPGESPRLEKGGEPKPLSMPYPGDEIVETMIAEVATPQQRDDLAAERSVETEYASDDGERYHVRLEPRGSGVRMVFRRPKAETAAATPPPALTPCPDPTPERAATAPVAADTRPGARAEPPGGLSDDAAARCEPGVLRPAVDRAVAEDASDILLSTGRPPHLRVGGELMALNGDPVTEAALMSFVGPALSERAHRELATSGSTDIAVTVQDVTTLHRFRANLFRQHHGLTLALRPIRGQPPGLRELGLPDELASLVQHHDGLVLLTGTTGSGKSTTLVALVEQLNRSAAKHVVTIEDPIEYEYTPKRSLIHQRQVGVHVDSFATGLRAALRETPDVILLGEMRDHATIAAALTAAETGHLVLSTLHAGGAPMAIDRMIDVFPQHQQNQVRNQLAAVLRAIVTQRLLPTQRPPARAPAVEVMRVNTAVAAKIREGRGHQLQSEIQKGRADGMLPLEASLASLVQRQHITVPTAIGAAPDPALLQQYLRAR